MTNLDNLTLVERLEHYPETISLFSLQIFVDRDTERDRGRNARIAPLAFLELERREETMDPERVQQAIERALQILEELEQAIDAGDNRKIGARLYELRRELETIKNLVDRR